jgi:DegT/DnrJ/EryC1/StrS aminotransferase family
VARAISGQTKANLPVHFGGHPAEMRLLLDLARQHGLAVVEDAAHALPARYEGRAIGTLGDFTAFSFYATKNLTTAEGGMLTGSPERIAEARVLSLHGMSRDAWQRYSAEGAWKILAECSAQSAHRGATIRRTRCDMARWCFAVSSSLSSCRNGFNSSSSWSLRWRSGRSGPKPVNAAFGDREVYPALWADSQRHKVIGVEGSPNKRRIGCVPGRNRK